MVPGSHLLRPPFPEASLLKGTFDTRSGPWVSISREAKAMVHRLLEMDPDRRITLPELMGEQCTH